MKNYIRLKGKLPFCNQYLFVDTSEKLFVRVMSDSGIKIRSNSVFIKSGTDIQLIICKIRKKDSEKFESIIGNVRNMALLLGYHDYDTTCEQLSEIGSGNENISC